MLQDFRWSKELIGWKYLLLFLKGENVKLPSPKNQFDTNVFINTNNAIFAISEANIEFVGKHSTQDDRETKMMDVRWKIFELIHRISQEDQLIPDALLN